MRKLYVIMLMFVGVGFIFSQTPGCTDPDAMNYNPDATIDDGSCVYDLTLGLVAYYPFNGDAIDESGNSNNGTVYGALLTNDRHGIANSAYSFDGNADRISIDHASIQNTTHLTIAMWLKPEEEQNQGWIHLIWKNTIGGSDGFSCLVLSDNKPYASMGNNNDRWIYSLDSLPANQWSQVVFSYDGQNNKIYINNDLSIEQANSGMITPSTSPIQIGGASYNDNYSFNGGMDDIRLFDRALSEAEINELYCENGWCDESVYGCTDPDAMNYNPDATEDDGSCEYTDTISDIDGNTYETIIIGDQEWTVENLRVTHYRNGDEIPNITNNSEWGNLTIGAYADYNNNPNNSDSYGRLYNWFALNDSRILAPEGWHLPTEDEWVELIDYLGINSGGKLKEMGYIHWSSPNEGATNESGFTGLPGGIRNIYGAYNNMGYYGYFWSSETYDNFYAWFRILNYDNSDIYHNHIEKNNGFSVRCVRDIIYGCTDPTANNYNPDATEDDGSCEYNTVTDIDGNIYNTVIIGDQEWMAENLKVTHYNNGEEIPTAYTDSQWGSLSTGAYAIYNNDPANSETYGNLYNWYAVDDSRNIAPEGWHVPSDEEWTVLMDYLGGESIAGGPLKEEGYDHWFSPNTGATNETGFTALPGGNRHSSLGSYGVMGQGGYYISSTANGSNNAWCRFLSYTNSELHLSSDGKQLGFSVRCVRDIIYGCTDSFAFNYCEECTEDDGSCIYDQNVQLSFGNVDYANHTIEIFMDSPNDVYGFQFAISETSDEFMITSASGGRAEDAGFSVSVGGDQIVLGFSFTGAFIPTGDGVLTYLTYNNGFITDEMCIIDPVISGGIGTVLSVDLGPCINLLVLGDANLDGEVDVIDIVEIVGIIFGTVMPTEEQLYTADYNQDGFINVQDIVEVVCYILDCNLTKGTQISEISVATNDNKFTVNTNGTVAGLQISVSGDFEITQTYLPTGWEIHTNDNIILMFSVDGSPLNIETLFEYTGDLVVESALVSDWLGNGIFADIEVAPESFSLGHAYPNPFNPVTTFEYHIPVDANVSIQIFDLTGRQVSELIPENTFISAGRYTMEFHAGDLPSGLYFVAMRAKSGTDEFTAKQKIVLLK